MTALVRSPGSQRWRDDVAQHLARAGLEAEADAFRRCGDKDTFNALLVCSANSKHTPIPLLHTCHLRICPECEGRAQHERLDHLLPSIYDAANFGPPGFSLKLVTLTTPHSLLDPDIETRMRERMAQARDTLKVVTYDKLEENTLFALMHPDYRLDERERLRDDELRRKDDRSLQERLQGRDEVKMLTADELLCEARSKCKRLRLSAHDIGFVLGLEFGENGLKLHFHALYAGPYLEHEKLAEKWSEMTGGACQVVDVRRVDDAREGAKEVIAKYATKLSVLPPGMAPRLHSLLNGTRRVRTYGSFYGLPGVCPKCGALIKSENLVACPKCGEPINHKNPVVCPECAAPMKYMSRFAWELLGSKSFLETEEISRRDREVPREVQRPPIPVPKLIPLPGIDAEAPAAAKWDTWHYE